MLQGLQHSSHAHLNGDCGVYKNFSRKTIKADFVLKSKPIKLVKSHSEKEVLKATG